MQVEKYTTPGDVLDLEAIVSKLSSEEAKDGDAKMMDEEEEQEQDEELTVVLGPGLVHINDVVKSTTVGQLETRTTTTVVATGKDTSKSSKIVTVNVARPQVIYTPTNNDLVIGMIKHRQSDSSTVGGGISAQQYYVVDLGPFSSSPTVLLNCISFNNATKRNKPDLKNGSLVYGKIQSVTDDSNIEMTCVSSDGLLGELKEGCLFKSSINQCNYLLKQLNTTNSKLDKLARKYSNGKNGGGSFEVVVGVNGYVWINSSSENMAHVVEIASQIL
ncbi:putative exosome complex component rrp40 [Zancudomyces culisetae]|uniref:Putative exosome complex component rrp40 n=1 Tax=Zancudomyces culisetae TaxID=1213189 RepID=A0A1R1PRZ7_ZANCU|nr:putative exosome complex component rrp40 [Zancudomyces culisetae]|eukprot:OMH83663.1 putative exosome complex component rrp40 [Zancudomyces culisetae]